MLNRVAGLLAAMAFGAGEMHAQKTCPDPAGRLIGVAPGVQVEVVEWSREGEPLLFIPGLGATAHAFDNFAPIFADRYRVLGITPRGWGRSSTSPGYDYRSSILVGDIAAVMDSLDIPAAHVVGWSFGGDEATLLAARYPTRVLTLTLLDSYDNSLAAATFAASDSLEPPLPPKPRDPRTTLSQILAQDRAAGGRTPVTDLCATSRFAADGRYLGPVSSDSLGGYTLFGAERLAYSAVTQPVLAIYSTMRGAEDMYPDLAGMDSVSHAHAIVLGLTVKREMDAARVRLRRAIPSAELVEIPGGDHAIFLSHPERVVQALRTFLNRHPRVF